MNTRKERPITTEKIEELREALKALPKQPKTRPRTKRAMVEELRGEIEAAVDRGYTYAQIASMLGKKGAPIAPGTLQFYMREAGVIRRRGRSRAKARGKAG